MHFRISVSQKSQQEMKTKENKNLMDINDNLVILNINSINCRSKQHYQWDIDTDIDMIMCVQGKKYIR